MVLGAHATCRSVVRMVGENESIDIPVSSAVGVLLLHGLFGTPNELHVLGGVLARSGYRVRIPLLPGRGASLDALDRLSWADVRESAMRDYEDLARDHERVVIGGLSAGGTLALDLALHRRPAALLLYAAALSLRIRAAYVAPYLWRVVRRWPPHRPVAERVPVRAVGELVDAMRRVRTRLALLDVPALVVHSREDPLVPVANAVRLEHELGGPVELVVREGSTHAVTAGDDRDEIAEVSLAFLRRRAPLAAGAAAD